VEPRVTDSLVRDTQSEKIQTERRSFFVMKDDDENCLCEEKKKDKKILPMPFTIADLMILLLLIIYRLLTITI